MNIKRGYTDIVLDDNTCTKIQNYIHKSKRCDIEAEVSILKDLTNKGSAVSPRVIDSGELKDGRKFYTMPRYNNVGKVSNKYDVLFATLALKGLGYIHGDHKPDNYSLEDGRCMVLDFDQALQSDDFKNMDMEQFAKKVVFINKNKEIPITSASIINMLDSEHRLDLSETTSFKTGVSTKNKTGVYHPVSTEYLTLQGERGIDSRMPVLSTIPFKSDETILDVGCNTGLLIRYLINRGVKWVDGYEYSLEHSIAGQMINNSCSIYNSMIYHRDMTKCSIHDDYDTIMLFSVLHHFNTYEHATSEITKHCKHRILLESRLAESGMVYENVKWHKVDHGKWNFTKPSDMTRFVESLFPGFKFTKDYGAVDRERHILEFTRQ